MNQMKKNRSIAILSIVMFFMAMMILLFLGSSKKAENYNIYFFDSDKCIAQVNLDVGKTISTKQLNEIEILIENEDNYQIAWSYKKNKYEPVDFSNIHSDTFVYLFKLENEFEILIEDSENYEIEIITDGPIKNGSNAKVNIKHHIDLNKYHPVVKANDKIIYQNIDGYYELKNITSDIIIEIEYLEIIQIKPIIKDYIYDGNPKEIEYELIDSNNNLLESKDIEIKIYDSNNNLINEIIDAGTYKVVYSYIGDIYSVEDLEINIEVSKATPTIDVSNIKLNYTGDKLGFRIEDVMTSSDGLITFENNEHIEIGTYEVLIKVSETKNYQAIEITKELEIIKAIPEIIKTPNTTYGHENYKLKDVELINGLANIPGKFTWEQPNLVLSNNMKEFAYIFIPDDLEHYEKVISKVEVEVLTKFEALEILQIERNKLYEELLPIFENKVNELPKLPTTTKEKVNISWMSTHTALSIDENGNSKVIGNDGIYNITLFAYLTFGDTVEYLEYSFELEINNAKKSNEEQNKKLVRKIQEETVSDEFDENFETEQIEVNLLEIESHNNELAESNSQNKEKENNIRTITTKQKQVYNYQANVNRHRQISEVILWKVISGETSDGSNNILIFNNKIKIKIKNQHNIQTMKGDII